MDFTRDNKAFRITVLSDARMAANLEAGRSIDRVSIYQLTKAGEINWTRGALSNQAIAKLRN